MTHPTPGGFRGVLYVVRPRVCPSFRASRQRWPRSGQNGSEWRPRTTTYDRARPRTTTHGRRTLPRTTTHYHARPRTTATHDHARPRTTAAHDHARPPHTTTHNHARLPRTTTHDRARPRTTTHDRARSTTAAIFVWGSGTYPTPGGFWSFRGLNCLARHERLVYVKIISHKLS